MSVHAVARDGFSRSAGAYARSRPEYPAEAVAHLRRRFGLGPASQIAELGAGTGKFTRALVRGGLVPIAFEPLGPMRAELRREVPGAEVVAATAERLPVAAHRIDAAFAASAFHWFDAPRVFDRLALALRPGGGVGLLWNVRVEERPWQVDLARLLQAHRPPDLPSHRSSAWREALRADGRYTSLETASFPTEQVGDLAMLRDRFASVSFVAALPGAEHEAFLREVASIGETACDDAPDGRVHLAYRTEVHTSTRRTDA